MLLEHEIKIIFNYKKEMIDEYKKEDYRNKDYYTEFDLSIEEEIKRIYKLINIRNETSPDEIFMIAKIKNIESKVA